MVVLLMILTKTCLVPYLAVKEAELLDHITENQSPPALADVCLSRYQS